MAVLEYQTPPPTRYDLRAIAERQRPILVCFIINIVLTGVLLSASLPVFLISLLALVALGVWQAIVLYAMTAHLYGKLVRAILVILAVVPICGLYALLAANSRATLILRSHGIRVGLWGAKMPPE